MAHRASSATAWIALALVALGGSIALWPAFRNRVAAAAADAPPQAWTPEAPAAGRLLRRLRVRLYRPATFLPVMAKQAMDDPSLFGWSWPAFGAAAAASTMIAGRLRASLGDRTVWIAANL
jgi:hypothetical protein